MSAPLLTTEQARALVVVFNGLYPAALAHTVPVPGGALVLVREPGPTTGPGVRIASMEEARLLLLAWLVR